jgi:eukaryotic-like serine/threonine-protein kinase
VTAGSTDALVGRLIDGRYQVRSRIARGGMATVYLATDLRLERKVAIKVMHGHLSDDIKFRDRFIQEARSAARLAHPNVVNVFDQGQDSDMAYLVMEYLPGITLRDLLQEHGSLTTDQTLDILEAVLAGLSAAHKAGIVHRDLKPENVLLADDGRIKIGDFGLARAASANTATGAALLGTIAYLSPELVTRGVADTRSDIYAVGIMTYEMVTGKQPFVGEQPMQIAYQHANDTVPAPSNENPRVPEELDELVLWATARDADERPRDARVLLNEVIAVRAKFDAESQETPTVAQRTMVMPPAATTVLPRGDNSETQIIAPARRADTPAPPSAADVLEVRARRRRGRGWWVAVLIVVLVAAAGGTGWYFGSGPGAHATVPSVAGDTIPAAKAALIKAGFQPLAATTTRNDPDVASGSVSGTNPAVGKTIEKNAAVTIIVSAGPALLQIPVLAGLPQSQAEAAIRSAKFLVGSPTIRQFDPKVTKGTVIDFQGSAGTSLLKQSTYSQKRPITLIVSAGPLPDVANLTVTAAEAKLKKAGLNATAGSEVYNPTVPLGNVVQIDPQTNSAGVGRVFRVGDVQPVLLITSRGPEMVVVPNVVGLTWAKAKAALLAANFTLSYNPAYDAVANSILVTSTNPAAGTSQIKGTKVKVVATFGGSG